jgi:hypothetical protein
MGKATELDDFLESQRLTPEEIRQRRLAEEISDPDIEVTLDGKLVKRQSATTTIVHQIPDRTWD